jgi:DNA-binding Xre family transcriptional regulator
MGKKRKAKRMSVSEQLRGIIRERHLSTYMVGKLAGMSPTRVNYFLRGGQLRTENLDKICEALGLELQPTKGD